MLDSILQKAPVYLLVFVRCFALIMTLPMFSMRAASRAAKICGLEESGQFEYELPHDLGHRTILVYTKTGNPRIKLPRQNGMAKRSPLGLH